MHTSQLSKYRAQFAQFYKDHYAHNEVLRPSTMTDSTPAQDLNSLARNSRRRQHSEQGQSELIRYLNGQTSNEDDPLQAWRREEREYPALALMARDILAVPISGVGVERTFNMARDVCHYRRGQLGAQTIEKVMIIKHRRRMHLDSSYEPHAQDESRGVGDRGNPAEGDTEERNENEELEADDDIEDIPVEDEHIYDFIDRD